MAPGPLAVRWGGWTLPTPQAGALQTATVELENAGTVSWRDPSLQLSYHWLDERGNPIHWDGIRTAVPPLEPGERATVEARVRGPVPPGSYRFALDMVAEFRSWFSQLGSPMADAIVEVGPRRGASRVKLPGWVDADAGWHARAAAAHAEGYAVVAGSIEWPGGLRHPRPHALEPYVTGQGRVPGFSAPLVCPSVIEGIELERLDDVAGLPAYAAPADEPWLYDGRLVLRARPQDDRPSS